MPRSISTDRLVLRSCHTDDAKRLATLIAAPEVHRWLPVVPHPYDLQDARDYISRAGEDPWKLAITLDGALIGGVTLAEQFGYWLGRPYWGRGFATEAARGLIGAWYAHHEGEVLSGHLIGNEASRRVLLKTGFRDSGKMQRKSLFLGETVTIQRMVLSDADWRAAA